MVVVSMAPTFASDLETLTLETLTLEAEQLAQRRDLESAHDRLARALETERSTYVPKDTDADTVGAAELMLASLRLAMFDAEGARRAHGRCPRRTRELAPARSIEADILIALGKPREAETIIAKLAREGFDPEENSLRLGRLRFERGDHRGALEAIETRLGRTPGDYYGIVYAARSHLELGASSEAVKILTPLVKTSPTPEVLYLVGRAHAASGDLEDAIAAFRRALGMQPDYPECVFALAHALRADGAADEARSRFREFRRLHRADWTRLKKASELTQACERADQSDATPWARLAKFHLDSDDLEGATSAAWNSLRRDRRNTQARLALARALRRSGSFSAAAHHLQKILRKDPTHAEAERELRDLVKKHAQR